MDPKVECHDPRHELPCPLPCRACAEECDDSLVANERKEHEAGEVDHWAGADGDSGVDGNTVGGVPRSLGRHGEGVPRERSDVPVEVVTAAKEAFAWRQVYLALGGDEHDD